MWHAVKAVLWAFLGIRSKDGYDKDRAGLTPKQIIGTGVFLAALFVLGLFILVRLLVAK
jgi:hypothetical protein